MSTERVVVGMGKAPFTSDRIKAIFFDVNETLLDPKHTFRQAFQEVWADMSARWDGEKPGAGELWASFEAHLRGNRSNSGRRDSWADTQKRNLAALAAAAHEHRLRLSESTLQAFLHKAAEQQEKSPLLYPGTAEALAALSKRYRLAIISNGIMEKQMKRLKAAGQMPPLHEEHMFFSSAVGARKPDPAIFLHALEKMGLRPNQTVMVGNSWNKDVLGGVNVHMNVVWFRPGRMQKHFRRKVGSSRIHVVQSMAELLALFET